MPESLKLDSGSYASNILNDNPMLAYNAMQLTGWSQYDYQNQGSGGNAKQEGKIREDHIKNNLGKGGKQNNRKNQQAQ